MKKRSNEPDRQWPIKAKHITVDRSAAQNRVHPREHLAFFVVAVSLGCLTLLELAIMTSASAEHAGRAIRWTHVPLATLVVSVVAFLQLYFGSLNEKVLTLATGDTVTVKQGFKLHLAGSVTFLGFAEASGSVTITLQRDVFSIEFDVSLNLGPLSVEARGGAAIYMDSHPGMALVLDVQVNANILEIIKIKASGKLELNTSNTARTLAGVHMNAQSFVLARLPFLGVEVDQQDQVRHVRAERRLDGVVHLHVGVDRPLPCHAHPLILPIPGPRTGGGRGIAQQPRVLPLLQTEVALRAVVKEGQVFLVDVLDGQPHAEIFAL